MDQRPSNKPTRRVVGLGLAALSLAGLLVAMQMLAVSVASVAAGLPPAQGTLFITPVTPTRTPTRTRTPTPPIIRLTATPVTPSRTPIGLQATPVTPVAGVNVMQVGPVLLAEAERRQNMQFNPNAALQKRIFADGLVPNSPEFRTRIGGVELGAQRAESLGSNLVRVYFVVVPDFANVQAAQRGNARNAREEGVLAAGEAAQVIQFNPTAALQRRMFADGFVPNSSEFVQVVDGVRYIGQRGERLDSGEVRVYFVRDGDFANVFFFFRR